MKIALIGDPIRHSKSHLVYAYVFKTFSLDLEFEKIQITKRQFIQKMAAVRGIDAFLVTMPLKSVALTFASTLCRRAKMAQSLNFMIREGRHFHGYNTDGLGAIESIECLLSIKNKKVLVLGAGGAASSICFEAKLKGADVYVYNRTHEKAVILEKRLDITAIRELRAPYDVIIQATSVGLIEDSRHQGVNPQLFVGCSAVLEINYSKHETDFIKYAKGVVKHIIRGQEMYYFMLKHQIKLLLGRSLCDSNDYKNILEIFLEINT